MSLVDHPTDPQGKNSKNLPAQGLPVTQAIGQRIHTTELTPAEWSRYRRQIVLDPIGPDGQKKIKAARVLLVGVGGLGSPALLYLAAAGIGTIGIVDGDRVDVSNLQRQVLYDTQNLQRSKVSQARDKALALNPEIKLLCFEEYLSPQNAEGIFSQFDLVIDGSDNFATRYLANDQAFRLGIPYVYASISQFLGQLSVFYPPHGPCYRCLFPEPPPPEAIPNCSEAGVLGTVAGIMGTMQAHEALKLVTGVGRPLIGKVMLFDALGMEWRSFELSPDPHCPLCAQNPVTKISKKDCNEVFLGDPCKSHDKKPGVVQADAEIPGHGISPQSLKALLTSEKTPHRGMILLDVRTGEERDRFGSIPGSWNIPLDELEKALFPIETAKSLDNLGSAQGDLQPFWPPVLGGLFREFFGDLEKTSSHVPAESKPILVIYCKTGPRSRRASKLIHDFLEHKQLLSQLSTAQSDWRERIKTLEGGYLLWMEH